ncbi:MAG: H-NS histone family protein [Zwartia sp.]|nr:H-NS histone family protein [Zwartia sp.]MDO9023970.1 H-NS histone family protein [Zwartia sp.]
MTRNYATQQAKIQKEIERLHKQAQSLQSKQRKPVISNILRSMKEYDITPEEIVAAFGKSGTKARKTGPKAAKAEGTRKPVAPKYRHPDTAATWTGRGKAPLWIVEAEKNGQPRQQFLI